MDQQQGAWPRVLSIVDDSRSESALELREPAAAPVLWAAQRAALSRTGFFSKRRTRSLNTFSHSPSNRRARHRTHGQSRLGRHSLGVLGRPGPRPCLLLWTGRERMRPQFRGAVRIRPAVSASPGAGRDGRALPTHDPLQDAKSSRMGPYASAFTGTACA
jgi:hypothetical protein